MPTDEVVKLLTNFRDTQLAPALSTHQTNLTMAQAAVAAETPVVAEYTDAIAALNAEIAKLTPPPPA